MRLISGIDTAMPDVHRRLNYHARGISTISCVGRDFRQLADCGFDLLRWQMPWSLIQPRRGEYKWELIDEKVELATRLGLEIFYPIAHFNYPKWIAGKTIRHAVYSPELSDHLAEYTERLLSIQISPGDSDRRTANGRIPASFGRQLAAAPEKP